MLEAAIRPLVPEERLVLYAAGRTDTGVHALGQVVSLVTQSCLPTERWAIALNSLLPMDIAVAKVEDMDAGFHARFSARARTYGYGLWTRRTRSALWGRYSMHVRRPLDIEAMRKAAAFLVGSHDFAAYSRMGGNPGKTTVRDLRHLSVRRSGDDKLLIRATANGFLRTMVRNIVGMLLKVGYGDLAPGAARDILETRDRIQNPCAPVAPQGLFLWRVDY